MPEERRYIVYATLFFCFFSFGRIGRVARNTRFVQTPNPTLLDQSMDLPRDYVPRTFCSLLSSLLSPRTRCHQAYVFTSVCIVLCSLTYSLTFAESCFDFVCYTRVPSLRIASYLGLCHFCHNIGVVLLGEVIYSIIFIRSYSYANRDTE